jgi:hypothetical protein
MLLNNPINAYSGANQVGGNRGIIEINMCMEQGRENGKKQ